MAFDDRIHHLEHGYWLKFEIRRVAATRERPHGLRYSFTLHDPNGRRLVGYDNAHSAPDARGRASASHDHWHRGPGEAGRPYAFTSADQLVADFFDAVRRVLAARGLDDTVTGESTAKERDEK